MPGGTGEELGAVPIGDGGPGQVDGLRGEVGGVRTHVRDPAVLVEALGGVHGPAGGPAQLAVGLLLERRGGEGGRGPLLERGLGDLADGPGDALKGLRQISGLLLVEDERGLVALLLEVAGVRIKVPALGQPPTAELHQVALVAALVGGEGALQIPPVGGDELQPGPLTGHDEAHGDGLHPARGEAGLHLAPEHRGDVVAEQPVDDAPRLLSPDQLHVQGPGRGQGGADGPRGDLMEDHALHRHLGLEHLQQVPGDGLPLAIFIGGEVDLRGLLEQGLELLDLLLAPGGEHIEGLEVVLDVHPRPGPLLFLHRLRDVPSGLRQIAHMADGGFHVIAVAEELPDGPGLRRGLHDYEWLADFVLSSIPPPHEINVVDLRGGGSWAMAVITPKPGP